MKASAHTLQSWLKTYRKVCEPQLTYVNAVSTCLQRILLPVVRKIFTYLQTVRNYTTLLISSVFCAESQHILKTTSRLLVHCSASSVKAKRCVCARVHSITESTGSEEWHVEDTVMSLYMYIVQESCTWFKWDRYNHQEHRNAQTQVSSPNSPNSIQFVPHRT